MKVDFAAPALGRLRRVVARCITKVWQRCNYVPVLVFLSASVDRVHQGAVGTVVREFPQRTRIVMCKNKRNDITDK